MSYDVYLEIDTGGAEPATVGHSLSHTFNCAPMFALALGTGGLRDLDGLIAGELINALGRAVDHITDDANAAIYKAMNPPNGWGSHETAAEFLKSLWQLCTFHPKATVRVCA